MESAARREMRSRVDRAENNRSEPPKPTPLLPTNQASRSLLHPISTEQAEEGDVKQWGEMSHIQNRAGSAIFRRGEERLRAAAGLKDWVAGFAYRPKVVGGHTSCCCRHTLTKRQLETKTRRSSNGVLTSVKIESRFGQRRECAANRNSTSFGS